LKPGFQNLKPDFGFKTGFP